MTPRTRHFHLPEGVGPAIVAAIAMAWLIACMPTIAHAQPIAPLESAPAAASSARQPAPTPAPGDGSTPDGEPSSNGEPGGPGIQEITPEELAQENDRLRQQIAALRAEVKELRAEKEPLAVPVPEGTRWRGQFEFSATLMKGNADALLFGGQAGVVLFDPDWFELSNVFDYEFIQAGTKTQQHMLYHTVRFDFEPDSRISPFVLMRNGFEEKQKYTWRFDVGLGATLAVLRQPWDVAVYRDAPFSKYAISLAVLFEHNQFQPNAATDHETFGRLLLVILAEQKLADELLGGLRFEYLPSLQDFADWQLRATVWLNLVAATDYSFRLETTYAEDARPATGVRRVDYELRIVLDLTIK